MRGKDPSEGVTASALWMPPSEPCLCRVIVTGKEWAPLEITHLTISHVFKKVELCPTEMRPPCVLGGQPPRACCDLDADVQVWSAETCFHQLRLFNSFRAFVLSEVTC